MNDMADNMGVSRTDKQQPIIIQNLDLFLPGQLKSKRKLLSTANLYLSAASFRRRGGTAVADDSTRLQNANSCGSVYDDMCNVNDHQMIPGSRNVQSANPDGPVLKSVPERSHLDQREQTSLLDTIHITQPRRTKQMFRSAKTYQEAALMSLNNTSADGNEDNTISNKINVIRKCASKDKLVQEGALENTPVTNQKSPLQETHEMKTNAVSEDKTACENSLSSKVNHSQGSFQLLAAERLSGKERSLNYISMNGYISDDVRNFKSHVKDKTTCVENNETIKGISNTCGALSVCEESKISTENYRLRPSSVLSSERCTQKGETRSRTKTKRVSFKLPDDSDNDDKCSSNGEIGVQKLVDICQWDEMSSSGDTDDVGQCGVYTFPKLVDTENVANYRSHPLVESPAIHAIDNPSNRRTRKCTKTVLLRGQQSSQTGRRSSGSNEFHDFRVNEQKVLKNELATQQRTEDESCSKLTAEVALLEKVSQQHRRCEHFQGYHSNQLYNKSDIYNIDYGASGSDEVYMPGKSDTRKPESIGHVDIDSILMKPTSENYTHQQSDFKKPNIGSDNDSDILSIKFNTQSDTNTDYLKRMYSNRGDAVPASSNCSVFNRDVNHGTIRLPEENLTDLSRQVGYINKKSKTTIHLNHPSTKHLQVSGLDHHFSVRRCEEARQLSGARSRPISIKDKIGVKDSLTYVDRYLFQVDRGENVRTLMNKRLENLIINNLRQHRQTSFLESSRTNLL